MLKVLFSRRMLAFHALVLLIVPSFIWLGFWQLDRAEQRAASVDLQRDNVAAEPVPVEELASVGGDVDPDDRWRTVEAEGEWDTDHQLLLRNRDGSQGVGFHVLTPLVTEDGTALLVNRGWIERGETAQDTPEVPPVPEGTIEVAGRLQFGETEENTGLREHGGLPEGQIMFVDVDRLSAELPYPIYGGYVELIEQDPAPDPAPERLALREEDQGMSASYAFQWWVFTIVVVVGWIILIRRELRDPPRDGSGHEAADGSEGEPGDGAEGEREAESGAEEKAGPEEASADRIQQTQN
ncbi:SURF1 family cytochrome oxidase biogenesis protein [Nocardiopsis sp. NPDC055551]